MKRILFVIMMILISMAACDKKSSDGDASNEGSALETADAFYAVGMYEARRIKQLEPTEEELEQIFQGIRDSIKGEAKFTDEEFQQQMAKINELVNTRMQNNATEAKEKGKEYLEKFAKKKDVEVTDSGIAYKIIKEGDGKKPSATDRVKVHYEGKLIDGTVFDSSIERGEPAEFALNQVIKGWTEGLQLISEGGSIELVIPSELAYGDRPSQKIPGGSTLIFNVDLIEILPQN